MSSWLRQFAAEIACGAIIVAIIGFLLSGMFQQEKGRLEAEAARAREERLHWVNRYEASKKVAARAIAHSDSTDTKYKALAAQYEVAKGSYRERRDEVLGNPALLSDTAAVKGLIALADAGIVSADSMKAGADSAVAASAVVKETVPVTFMASDSALVAASREIEATRKLVPGRIQRIVNAGKWVAVGGLFVYVLTR